MSGPTSNRLPRGRHGLTREQVEQSQRERLLTAMADAMSQRGYADTSVEDVLKPAGVSRESFYRLFRSKADCFMAAFDHARDRLLGRVAEADTSGGDPVERFERLFTAYLGALAAEPALARLFLVEVHAAGPEAIRRRLATQQAFVDAIAGLLEVRSESGRFACRMIVAAVSAMVVGPLVSGELDELNALAPAVTEHVRLLWNGGVFG